MKREPKLDPMAGITVLKCKGCKEKFVSYGGSLCSRCVKEK